MSEVARTKQVVTLKAIALEASESLSHSRTEVEAALQEALNLIASHIAAGDMVRISGFGVFEAVGRRERVGRHPGTGEPLMISAGRRVAFRPAKDLRDML